MSKDILYSLSEINFSDDIYLEIIVIWLARYGFAESVINIIDMYNLDVHMYDDVIIKLLTSYNYYENIDEMKHVIEFMQIYNYDINYNNGALINNNIFFGECALCYSYNDNILELLLQLDADPNLINHTKKTLLFASGDIKIIGLLMQYGIDFQSKEKYIHKANDLVSLGMDPIEVLSIYLESISIIKE